MEKNFVCKHCGLEVKVTPFIGTNYRNHCPFCLWSTHVDWKHAQDRQAKCGEKMEPIGLTFKDEKPDKYGKPVPGELMVIHKCLSCGKISINRIAADDETGEILDLFEKTLKISAELLAELNQQSIRPLTKKDKNEVRKQLFGVAD